LVGHQARNLPSSKLLPVPQGAVSNQQHSYCCNLGATMGELAGTVAALQTPESCMGEQPALAGGF